MTKKERRAAAARRRYWEDVESARARCRVAKATSRAGLNDEPSDPYHPESYADEWMFLSLSGVRAEDIIARCRPSRTWFINHVMPLVTRAVCSYCADPFNPQVSGMLTRCSFYCGSTAAR